MHLAVPSAVLFAMLRIAASFTSRATVAPFARGAGVVGIRSASLTAAGLLRGGGNNAALSSSSSSSSSSSLSAEKERPFRTWTFDDACGAMDWTEAPPASLSIVAGADADAALDDADLVIVGVFDNSEDKEEEEDTDADAEKEVKPIVFAGKAKELDDGLGGALTELAAENSVAFQNGAEAGSTSPVMRIVTPGSKAKRYMLLGLGKADKEKGVDNATVMKLGAAAAAACHDQKRVSACGLLLPPGIDASPATISDFSASFRSNLYADNRYRTGKKVELRADGLESLTLAFEGGVSDAPAAEGAAKRGSSLAKGVSLAKDIVNAPHNVLNSISLAETARRIADESDGCMTCTVLGKEECEARGMGAYLGVARGSETPPQFIHLTYRPKSGDFKKKVAVVGKGLLFDTGGYNIKVGMMEVMKSDCGGAGAVLGAALAISESQPEGVEAHFIVAACENMINDRAMVPSDILTASNGKTIEVLNTDAEGRLTLADALVYADKELGCEKIIELSTLTGACMVSLGNQICGVWTDDDDLADDLKDISKVTGDKSWRMPLAKEYKEQLKSKIADMSNLGDRYGGAITAALFLQEFVSEKKPFAHIDIAGPAWDDKSGGTGFGAKLVSEWVRRQGE